MRTAEQRNGFALVTDNGIPDLRGAPHMYGTGGHFNFAFTCGAEMIGFQFNGREITCTFRQTGDATITTGGIGQRDDATRMQITVGRQQMGKNVKFSFNFALSDREDMYP